jgi:hypothetical protein
VTDRKDIAETLRSQYGYGDSKQKLQLFGIATGLVKLKLEGEAGYDAVTEKKGIRRTVTLAGYKPGMSVDEQMRLGVTLGHEAYRTGVVDRNNEAETVEAVKAHTELADRMRSAGYSFNAGGVVGIDLAAYDYARSVGDMSIMDAYADMFYNSDGDYLDIKAGTILDLVEKNQTKLIHFIPLGGDYSDTDKTLGQVDNTVGGTGQFLLDLAGGGLAGLIYSLVEPHLNPAATGSDIAQATAGVLAETVGSAVVEKLLKVPAVSGLAAVASGIATQPDGIPQNYTQSQEEFRKIAALERELLAEEGLGSMFDKEGIGYNYQASRQNGRVQNYTLKMYSYKTVGDVISVMQAYIDQNPKYAGLIKINPSPPGGRFVDRARDRVRDKIRNIFGGGK